MNRTMRPSLGQHQQISARPASRRGRVLRDFLSVRDADALLPSTPPPGSSVTETAKLPWMKFYPVDWRGDEGLRMSSLAARGLWMEMLTVMHGAEPRGSLRVNGAPLTSPQLAKLAGASPKETHALLRELEKAGVFSRDPDGTILQPPDAPRRRGSRAQ